MRRLTAATLATGVLIGCGANPSAPDRAPSPTAPAPDRASFIDALNAACREARGRERRAPKDSTPPEADLRATAIVYVDQMEQLARLAVPADEALEFRRFREHTSQEVATIRALADAVEGGDGAAAYRIAEQLGDIRRAKGEAGLALGARLCRAPASLR